MAKIYSQKLAQNYFRKTNSSLGTVGLGDPKANPKEEFGDTSSTYGLQKKGADYHSNKDAGKTIDSVGQQSQGERVKQGIEYSSPGQTGSYFPLPAEKIKPVLQTQLRNLRASKRQLQEMQARQLSVERRLNYSD